jgi:hypothetical protein
VTLVSADALAEERTGTTCFRAGIAIDKKALEDMAGIKIMPGMPVEAFRMTTERTPLSFLLRPFIDHFPGGFPRSLTEASPGKCYKAAPQHQMHDARAPESGGDVSRSACSLYQRKTFAPIREEAMATMQIATPYQVT